MPDKNLIYKLDTSLWTIERAIFLIAGIFVLFSLTLAFLVSQNFLYFTLLVGVMLISFSLTGYCPIAIIIGKIMKNKTRS